jgi:hypothetical protein
MARTYAVQRHRRTTASAPAPDLRKRGERKLVITPDGETHRSRPRVDSALVKALARAHRWHRLLESGECASITDFAAAEKIDRSYLCRVLRLTLLVPEIVEAIMHGRQPEWGDLAGADERVSGGVGGSTIRTRDVMNPDCGRQLFLTPCRTAGTRSDRF